MKHIILHWTFTLFPAAIILAICVWEPMKKEPMNQKAIPIRIFLCGDVMTGRGIDQILQHPSDPQIHESYVKDARDYVRLAERKNGPIPSPADERYIWGDALQEFDRVQPEVQLINLETSITTHDKFWPGKGIQYRMHPENASCLSALGKLCCSLANNHVLDWGREGLKQTLRVLDKNGIPYAGAGIDAATAKEPALIPIQDKGRLILFSYGMSSSGIPFSWEAGKDLAGENLLRDISANCVMEIGELVRAFKRPGDIVVLSLHWGENWGYEITEGEVEFAHNLIDNAQIDLLWGHSSHHFKGMEVYNNKLILYGCGDFINDYEGIGGQETYRGDISLMYFPKIDAVTGELLELEISPMVMRKFSLQKAGDKDLRWTEKRLNRECRRFSGSVDLKEGQLRLEWSRKTD